MSRCTSFCLFDALVTILILKLMEMNDLKAELLLTIENGSLQILVVSSCIRWALSTKLSN